MISFREYMNDNVKDTLNEKVDYEFWLDIQDYESEYGWTSVASDLKDFLGKNDYLKIEREWSKKYKENVPSRITDRNYPAGDIVDYWFNNHATNKTAEEFTQFMHDG